MSGRTRIAASVLLVVAAAVLTGCADAGDLSIENRGPDDVVIDPGDEDPFTVDADGGAVLLDYGCSPGDVVVTFPSGRRVTVPGPVCPDQQIVVRDGTARVTPAG